MVKTREITILLEKTYFTWKFYFKKLILKKFTWTLFILFSCFYIFVQLPIFILILIIIIMIIFVIIVFVFVIAIITSSFSKLLTFIFLVFTILFIFVYIEFFWILNKWCGWALFKVGNKDTETVSVSLTVSVNFEHCLINLFFWRSLFEIKYTSKCHSQTIPS